MKRVLQVNLLIFLILLTSMAAGLAVYSSMLGNLREIASGRLALGVASVQNEMSRVKIAAKLVAASNLAQSLLLDGEPQTPVSVTRSALESAAGLVGATQIQVLDKHGRVVFADSEPGGYSYPDVFLDSAVAATRQGALGLSVSNHEQPLTFSVALPVWQNAEYLGAVRMSVTPDWLSLDLSSTKQIIIFTDTDGQILISNRPSLIETRIPQLAIDGVPVTTRRFDVSGKQSINLPVNKVRANEVIGVGPVFRERSGEKAWTYLVTQVRAPELGLMAWSFSSVQSAAKVGWLTGLLTLLLLGLLMLLVRLLSLRRRQALQQLQREADYNSLLEQRVAERTAELTQLNEQLRLEIHERMSAQSALHLAEGRLIQAEKLSVLGQLSAGVSHEMNQPLTAIRSHADNAVALLQRGDLDRLGNNLYRIAEVTEKASRILRNFRAFARNEVEPAQPVPWQAIIDDTLLMLRDRLKLNQVTVSLELPTETVWVLGGEVRLQQVLTNLINNAIDAMESVEFRQLSLVLTTQEHAACLIVSDTGVGASQETVARMFMPFVSNKGRDDNRGLGLGLTVAQHIVESFNGTLSVSRNPQAGLSFQVELLLTQGPMDNAKDESNELHPDQTPRLQNMIEPQLQAKDDDPGGSAGAGRSS